MIGSKQNRINSLIKAANPKLVNSDVYFVKWSGNLV